MTSKIPDSHKMESGYRRKNFLAVSL